MVVISVLVTLTIPHMLDAESVSKVTWDEAAICPAVSWSLDVILASHTRIGDLGSPAFGLLVTTFLVIVITTLYSNNLCFYVVDLCIGVSNLSLYEFLFFIYFFLSTESYFTYDHGCAGMVFVLCNF